MPVASFGFRKSDESLSSAAIRFDPDSHLRLWLVAVAVEHTIHTAMLGETQESFRNSLKAMLETRLHNRQITGVNIEVLHNGGNLAIRATGNAASISEAERALRDYCSLIDYVICD